MNTIIACLDFSPVSRRVIAMAAWLAQLDHATVTLVHIVPPPPVVPNEVWGLAASAGVDEPLRAAARRLDRVALTLAARGIAADSVCVAGPPADQVVELARKRAAGCIVLGSHGHTALYNLVIGGTASGVLKHAPCPVLVVPAIHRRRARQKYAV